MIKKGKSLTIGWYFCDCLSLTKPRTVSMKKKVIKKGTPAQRCFLEKLGDMVTHTKIYLCQETLKDKCEIAIT